VNADGTREDAFRFWSYVLLSCGALSVSLYALFGHSLIKGLYREGTWGPVHLPDLNFIYSVEEYLSLADWFLLGWLANGFVVWVILALLLVPARVWGWLGGSSGTSAVWCLVATAGAYFWHPLSLAALILFWLALAGWFGPPSDFPELGLRLAATWLGAVSVLIVLGWPGPWLDPFFREDFFFETQTALFFFVGGVLMLRSGWAVQGPPRVFCLLFAVFMLFVAAEEVSWGQRFLGFTTPEFLSTNQQGESNLHNLRGFPRELYPLVMLAWGVVLPLANLARPAWFARMSFPVPPWFCTVCVLLGLAVHTPASHDYYHNTDEIREWMVSLGFVYFAMIWHWRFSRSSFT
jgi:hypothetical protein